MKDDSARAVSWMEQWRAAGPALEKVRERELRDLTDDQALAAADELLSMASAMPLPPDRLETSGLVAQQALFHRLAARGTRFSRPRGRSRSSAGREETEPRLRRLLSGPRERE